MKRFLTAVLSVLMLVFGLFGCGCDDGENVDLVFLNETDMPITSVSIETIICLENVGLARL